MMYKSTVVMLAKCYLEKRLEEGRKILESPYLTPSEIKDIKKIMEETIENIRDLDEGNIID